MARLTDTSVKAIAPPRVGQAEHSDDLVQGLRLRVGAGGRKAWIVRTRAAGKPINKTLGAYPVLGVADARELARKFLLNIAKNGAVRGRRTFGDVADHWIENVAKVRNKSWQNQLRRLEIYVLPHWRDRDLETIRRGDVRDLIDDIDGEVAPSRALAIIRTIFRYALSRDWLDASPAEAISVPNTSLPRDRFLDMEEVTRVWSAIDLLGYPMAGFTKMLFLTAQRRTEVAAMRWDQLDLEGGTWVLSAAETKASRQHLVPLSPQAVALLRVTPQIGPFVWTTNGRSHVKGYSKAKLRLDGFVTATGQPLKSWRLHDIRRTVATHMVRLGVPETVVGRVLNHAAKGVTAKVYALHSYEPEKRNALARWAAEIERAVTGNKTDNVVAFNV